MTKTTMKKTTISVPVIKPLVYDIPSAAQALLLSPSTVRKLIHRGLLPVSRIGDRVLIQEKSMRKLLDEAEGGEGITSQSLNAQDWLREGDL